MGEINFFWFLLSSFISVLMVVLWSLSSGILDFGSAKKTLHHSARQTNLAVLYFEQQRRITRTLLRFLLLSQVK